MVELGPSVWLISLLTVVVILAVPVAIVWLIVVVIRKSGDGTPPRRYDPAAEQLRYRYARGEISEAEFQQGMHMLGYERAP
jgi:uncharacterized membrane protein